MPDVEDCGQVRASGGKVQSLDVPARHSSTGPRAPVGLQGPRGLHCGGGGKGLRGNTESRDPWFQGSTVRSAIGVDSGPRVTGFDPLFVNFIRLSSEGNWRQVWVAGGADTAAGNQHQLRGDGKGSDLLSGSTLSTRTPGPPPITIDCI